MRCGDYVWNGISKKMQCVPPERCSTEVVESDLVYLIRCKGARGMECTQKTDCEDDLTCGDHGRETPKEAAETAETDLEQAETTEAIQCEGTEEECAAETECGEGEDCGEDGENPDATLDDV